MHKIAIMTSDPKDPGYNCTRQLFESIRSRGAQALISDELALAAGLPASGLTEAGVLDAADGVICLGGDGTFLRVSREAYKRDTAVLGINLGTLGFLTEAETSDIDSLVEQLLSGQYRIENRMMLAVTVHDGNHIIAKDVALNDVVVSRVALSRILHLKTFINEDFLDSFPGDGIIVATPTGSTAYSFSAGGPIVDPDLDLMLITPICPHILYSRSVITSSERTVRIEVEDHQEHNAMVTVDGQQGYRISGGYTVTISRSPYGVRLIRLHSRNFFKVLRTKIYDRGESLRRHEV